MPEMSDSIAVTPCPTCGAANHGNLTCPVCRQSMREQTPEISHLLDRLDAAHIPVVAPVGLAEVRDFVRRMENR